MAQLTPLDPARTALLVMDYQTGILASYDAEGLVDTANDLIAAARAAGAMVGYVRVALEPDEAAAVPPTNLTFSAAAASGRLSADDPARELHPGLDVREGEPVFRKVRVGALSTTDADAVLRGRGIDTLLLAGVSTSGVILSTVRDAADRDYRLVVIADACADNDPEVHRVLTEKVFPRQAAVVTAAEVLAALG